MGTALLNTVFASAVTGYLADHVKKPAAAAAAAGPALIHGYHVAFVWGAALLAVALLATIVLINAKKEDVPAGVVPAA